MMTKTFLRNEYRRAFQKSRRRWRSILESLFSRRCQRSSATDRPRQAIGLSALLGRPSVERLEDRVLLTTMVVDDAKFDSDLIGLVCFVENPAENRPVMASTYDLGEERSASVNGSSATIQSVEVLPDLELSLDVDPDAGSWQVFGELTSPDSLAGVLGLAAFNFDVIGTGGINIDDSTVLEVSTSDFPLFPSAGTFGFDIRAAQNIFMGNVSIGIGLDGQVLLASGTFSGIGSGLYVIDHSTTASPAATFLHGNAEDGFKASFVSQIIGDSVIFIPNAEPSFTTLGNQAVDEDSGTAGAHVVSAFATASPGGGPHEASQTFSYTVSNNNSELFLSQPAIDANGVLTYTLAQHANGQATVTASVTDSGGTDGGGDDTSPDQTFQINVTAVNDSPSFVKGANHSVLENAGLQTVADWASSISAGPADEELVQSLSFDLTNTTNPDLFSVAPAIAADGTLSYTPADDTSGVSTITLVLLDDGGTDQNGDNSSAPQSFSIIVGLTDIDAADIDLVYENFGNSDPDFDPNGDGVVDKLDIDVLVRIVLETEYGDANLDRVIDIEDFGFVFGNFGRTDVGWADGDVNGDNIVDIEDFGFIFGNFGFGSSPASTPATEANSNILSNDAVAMGQIDSTLGQYQHPHLPADALFRALEKSSVRRQARQLTMR